MDFVHENILELKTPVGAFTVAGAEGKIPFCVSKRELGPYELTGRKALSAHGKKREPRVITCDTVYDIAIPTRWLEIRKDYVIRFDQGRWAYLSADERTTSNCTRIGSWLVGLGAYEPNEEELARQMRSPVNADWTFGKKPVINEMRLEQYWSLLLPDRSGCTFRLLDRSREYIYFAAAWLKLGSYNTDDYYRALGYWVT